MASVTWPLLVAAAPSSRSRKVARPRDGTAAARHAMTLARMAEWGDGTLAEPFAMKAVEPQRNTGGRFVMTADPAILKRIRGCPFAGGGRVLVRFRANGYSLFARRSGEPLARLRLTGNSDEVVLLYPSHRGGWGALGDFGASAMSLDKALQCLSDNPYFLDLHETTVEPLQRIDAKQECCSLETTARYRTP